ncbi:phosphatase PAP2 family protein [Piscirickettsia litoralis]|uniref:Phosphatidic acid phosphatase type 2/haloperoxidase domain-containing protein n=1 Tax=Piscirickettsia litoralis TaxID=1891921 RepID=A0ABX3A491_9GAMM|nr:phosphatase PAP2 family protein [Piscirickettsia litoralis]ODN42471.1 hypothetical protein BGC07_05435 [Piscirickettsia litoralis]
MSTPESHLQLRINSTPSYDSILTSNEEPLQTSEKSPTSTPEFKHTGEEELDLEAGNDSLLNDSYRAFFNDIEASEDTEGQKGFFERNLNLKSDFAGYVFSGLAAWAFNEGVKRFNLQQRPNKEDNKAWPSGHSGWGAMLAGLAFMMSQDKEIEFCGKTLTFSKKGVFAVGLVDALITMAGRVFAKKHWIGDTLSGFAISAQFSMIAGNLLAARRGQNTGTSTSYTRESIVQTLSLLSAMVSNPLAAIPLQLSLAVATQISEYYAKGTVYGNKVNGLADVVPAILKGLFAANLHNYKDMSKKEFVAAVFQLVATYGGMAANFANLPFTQNSGWKTALEKSIYKHYDKYREYAELGTWGTAMLSVVGGTGVSLMRNSPKENNSTREQSTTPFIDEINSPMKVEKGILTSLEEDEEVISPNSSTTTIFLDNKRSSIQQQRTSNDVVIDIGE